MNISTNTWKKLNKLANILNGEIIAADFNGEKYDIELPNKQEMEQYECRKADGNASMYTYNIYIDFDGQYVDIWNKQLVYISGVSCNVVTDSKIKALDNMIETASKDIEKFRSIWC